MLVALFGLLPLQITSAYKITTYAGGTYGSTGEGVAATSAKLLYAFGVAVDANGDLFVADRSNHAIRKVAASTNIITTYAGKLGLPGSIGDGGAATSAQLNYPWGVTVDANGNFFSQIPTTASFV